MPDKREQTLTIKLSDFEMLAVRQAADSFDMDVSELVRGCICIGLPVFAHVPFVRRVRLEDNRAMQRVQ
ncbi:MAG: hypothetical protein HDQ89_10305 [Desulfovibrio sp.]|nr:hypothetical protein [Desulfovibrio sp.]